jgi:hypothetical protein
MAAHGVQAVLVVGKTTGAPLGWITATGLLPWLEIGTSLITVRNAITQEPLTEPRGDGANGGDPALASRDHARACLPGRRLPTRGVITALDLVRWASESAHQ